MTSAPQSVEPSVGDSRITYEILLDELAEVLREGDPDRLEAFLRAHPQEEQPLGRMVRTLSAMAALAEPVASFHRHDSSRTRVAEMSDTLGCAKSTRFGKN